MASPTRKTDLIRKRKQRSAGSIRKASLKNNGSTVSKAKLFGDEEEK